MRTTLVLGLTIWFTAASLGAESSSDGWRVFRSSKYRYTVRYPASWYLDTSTLEPAVDHLDILSFPPSQRVEGVVLKKGGASIEIVRAPRDVASLEQWIRERTKLAHSIRRRPIRELSLHTSGCNELEEVDSDDEVGPNTFQTATDFYCRTFRGLYVVMLTNWRGDEKQERFREVALQVALSFRAQ